MIPRIRHHVSRHMRALRKKLRTRRLVIALCIAFGLTAVLTIASLIVYKVGGYYRYDLSRPGYEKERSAVTSSQTTVTYDTTSLLNKSNTGNAIQDLNDRLKSINDYNTFKEDSLSDSELQLTTN